MGKKHPASFQNSGEFLNWWLKEQRLTNRWAEVFSSYYSNYSRNFDGYLKNAWTDRHLELDECLSRLKGIESLKILDLGCGIGSVSLYLAYRLQGKAAVLGIDINEERIHCALERLRVLRAEIKADLDCNFRSTNILDLSPDERFDLIYMEETFHHLEPREKAVKKIAHILNENGLLLISEVNALNPFMQALLFKRRRLNTIIKKIDEQGHCLLYGNERIITLNALEALFYSHGLKQVSTRYFRVFNSSFARGYGKYLDLMALEKKMLKIRILKYLFTIHYNVVFRNK